jgi:hypothetical protein
MTNAPSTPTLPPPGRRVEGLKEIAEVLGVRVERLRGWIKTGRAAKMRLPVARVLGRYFADELALREWWSERLRAASR